MATSSVKKENLVDWVLENDSGPKVAFHTGVVINDCFYVHGGVLTNGSTTPTNLFFKYSIDSKTWAEITEPNSPHLSHHTSLAIDDRYMLLIGGWNGKGRGSEIYAFDTNKNVWLCPKTSGFPTGAGLSSHTATLLQNGDILIIGREGSLRTQRRSGNAFFLRGSVEKGSFTYSDFPIHVSSRSGHTVTPSGSKLVIIGGRSDKLIEQHGDICGAPENAAFVTTLLTKSQVSKPLAKLPCGRKNHVAISGVGCLFIHGGETFDGRSRDPVGHMFLIKMKPQLSMNDLGTSEVGRAGHVVFTHEGHVYIYGGIGAGNAVKNEVYQLQLT